MGKKSSKKKAVVKAVMDRAGVSEAEARALVSDAKKRKFIQRRDGVQVPERRYDTKTGKLVSMMVPIHYPKDTPNEFKRNRKYPHIARYNQQKAEHDAKVDQIERHKRAVYEEEQKELRKAAAIEHINNLSAETLDELRQHGIDIAKLTDKRLDIEERVESLEKIEDVEEEQKVAELIFGKELVGELMADKVQEDSL